MKEKKKWRDILTTNLADLSGQQIDGKPDRSLADSNFQEFLDEFHAAPKNNEQAQQFERFVVIKEACGNGFVAIASALLILGMQLLVAKVPVNVSPNGLLATAFAVVIALLLRKMHLIHVDRQFRYMVKVMEEKKRSPTSPSPTYAAEGEQTSPPETEPPNQHL